MLVLVLMLVFVLTLRIDFRSQLSLIIFSFILLPIKRKKEECKKFPQPRSLSYSLAGIILISPTLSTLYSLLSRPLRSFEAAR